MAYELPAFYDSVQQVIRPMDVGDQIPPAQLPISMHVGNIVQSLSDGLYVGAPVALATAAYVNTVTGVDAITSGAVGTPFKSLDYALAQLSADSVNGQLATSIVVVLQAGQTFAMNNDLNLYGGTLTFTFYGDPNYGAYTNVPVTGTTTNPWYMTDLERPIIAPAVSLVSTYWHMAGVNIIGGNVVLEGVEVILPMAPAGPAISLYSNAADFVRSSSNANTGSYVELLGAVVNMQDPTAFWGIVGVGARSALTLIQYGSQFQVNGLLIDAANNPSSAQLLARQYFIKFYPDFVGNNQQQGVLYDTAITATAASGLLSVMWADVQSFTVETTKTNLASYPIAYDLVYGLRNYIFGAIYDTVNRPVNVNSSRAI